MSLYSEFERDVRRQYEHPEEYKTLRELCPVMTPSERKHAPIQTYEPLVLEKDTDGTLSWHDITGEQEPRKFNYVY